ncbi:MAG: thiamine-phosphate kinase [Desulfobacteraceae bacterium]
METLESIGEFGLIRRIRHILETEGVEGSGVIAGAGDDTAVFEPRPGYDLLVTCDAMVEGRHYLAGTMEPIDLGRRAMVMNISDIGAMGGWPRWAVVSLGLADDSPVEGVEALTRGFLEELNPLNAVVAGGNITKAVGGAFIDITLIGDVETGFKVLRSGARPGDAILVTGFPGQAAVGLQCLTEGRDKKSPDAQPLVNAYLRPGHRAREGQAAARTGRVHAMIDISDGFLGDLAHICEESRVGAEVLEKALPVSRPLRRMADQRGRAPGDMVMAASDDYELILTCAPEDVENVKSAVFGVAGAAVTEVGRMTPEAGRFEVVHIDGSRSDATAKGWDHFARS